MSTNLSFRRQLMRIQPADKLESEAEHSELKRTMGLTALTLFSVGCIVGTGIFVILGEAVPMAGPAVLLAFVLAAITCAFSAFSYAELAGSIPVSGSSYSYTFATLGESIAWIVGWCLILEYGVSVSAVAVGWGQYLNDFVQSFGLRIPGALANPPGVYSLVPGAAADPSCSSATATGADLSTAAGQCVEVGVFNLPAVVVVVLCMLLLLRGASESATANTIMVLLKIGILLFFCAIAFTHFDADNLTPFMPLGFAGASAAAGQVFFSYIGFDAASTAGEEAKNAKKDLPRAIILSLIIVTVLYIVVALAALGARPWEKFEGAGTEAVLAGIAHDVTGSEWAPALIALGAVISIFSVVLVTMYGQTRILFAMGRDGLLPKIFTKVNPKTQTPVANTIIVTVAIVTLAAFVPLGELMEATSIGTLFAFTIVNFGVIALWRARPELERTFRVPLMPLFPILGVVLCVYLMSSLEVITWVVFALWLSVGIAIYVFYGRRHSNAPSQRPAPIADNIATANLSTRSLKPAAIVGVVLLAGGALLTGREALTVAGLVPWERGLWGLVAISCLVGAFVIVNAFRADKVAIRDMQSGDDHSAATGMRQAIVAITLALVIPGLLAVTAARVARPHEPATYHPSNRHIAVGVVSPQAPPASVAINGGGGGI